MTFLLLFLVLAQPGECRDRSPGISKCVEYGHGVNAGKPFTTCKASCYYGKRPDGGTYGTNVHDEVPADDEPGCKKKLEDQAANGCKPK
jgi:hypothetical protein